MTYVHLFIAVFFISERTNEPIYLYEFHMNLLFTDKLLRDIENISKMELRDWNDLARNAEINIKKLKMMLHLQVLFTYLRNFDDMEILERYVYHEV